MKAFFPSALWSYLPVVGVVFSAAMVKTTQERPLGVVTTSTKKLPQAGKAVTSGRVVFSLPATKEDGTSVDLVRATPGWKVIYFWSPSCPCVRSCQTLSLFDLWQTYHARDVAFYAVASNAGDIATRELNDGTRRSFLSLPSGAGQAPPYPIVLDAGHKVANTLEATKTPQTFLVNPQGRIVWMGNPDNSEEIRQVTGKSGVKTRNYLADALVAALASKPQAKPSPVLGCDIDRSDTPHATP